MDGFNRERLFHRNWIVFSQFGGHLLSSRSEEVCGTGGGDALVVKRRRAGSGRGFHVVVQVKWLEWLAGALSL